MKRSLKKRLYWFVSNDVRRYLGVTSMQLVLRGLKRRAISLRDKDALEVFGGTGEINISIYGPLVRSLTIWEIVPDLKPVLEQRFPYAKVTTTDSFEEIKRETRKFNLIHIDNPPLAYGDYCEHFQLFPAVFERLRSPAVMILNVLPFATSRARQYYRGRIMDEEHLAHRRDFYRVEHADYISWEVLVGKYAQMAEEAGFRVDWHFLVPRTNSWSAPFLYYLTMGLG